MRTPIKQALILSALALLGACSSTTTTDLPKPVTPANHRWFPLEAGTLHEYGKTVAVDGVIACESCHPASAPSFTEVQCNACHKHTTPITTRLHLGAPEFPATAGSSAGCYQCHPTGEKRAFSHSGIAPDATGQCAECHQVDNAFAALPKPNFTHPAMGGDCGGCHLSFVDWADVSAAPNGKSDPAHDLTLTALVPSFTNTTIQRVTPLQQTLPMPMTHSATALDAGVAGTCNLCHLDANNGNYFPGLMHWSLGNAGVPQPTRCAECHTPTQPTGFVGPLATAPARTPGSGEMRHDGVSWVSGAPTTTRLVSADCATCHQAPDHTLGAAWSSGKNDAGTPFFHASLTAAFLAQPTSCLDCHANSRPLTALTSSNATVPAGMSFDHSATEVLGDCVTCHLSTSVWRGGKFHPAASPPLRTCLPCHAQERPTSTTGWTSATYTRSPFDYGGNDAGITHVGSEDCAGCHAGNTQAWTGGSFPHGPGTLATTTCSGCHTSQRPAAPVSLSDGGTPFDHSLNGTGDCRACHQATVTAGRYLDYFRPGTMTLPGGDWKGGKDYPGDVVVTSPTQFINLVTYRLTRPMPMGLVTGMTTQNTTLFNAMLHTSAAIPAQVSPGPVSAPDVSSCWHCHTNTAGTVTAFADGKFHSALNTFRATVGGVVAPLPQPTNGCFDCHEAMRPNLIVEKAASPLTPMDHSARFTSSVMLGGQPTTSIANVECSVCHQGVAGTSWNDGQFHSKIGAGTPAECVVCHYPLMATAAADVVSGTTFQMKHRSTQLTSQKCDTCHTNALSHGATVPSAAPLWRTSAATASTLHPHVTAQPTGCLDCHGPQAPFPGSDPATATQSTVTYAFTTGGTTTNGAMWMSHTGAPVTSRDCVTCHTTDAKTSNSAWNRGTAFHAVVASPGNCALCHGTGNGRGTVIGTNNNLPAAIVSTTTTTTASNAPGAKDQIIHSDLNVTAHDCSFCHTQKGPSTVAGIMGQEWKKATFHRNFTASNLLVSNGSTARCSNCHLNVKPGPAFTAQDHSTYTATSASDCAACHAWPGTSATRPNWLGATGAHASSGSTTASTLDCNTCHGLGGTSSKQLRVAAASHYGGITNGNKCTSCHIEFSAFKGTIANLKYGHTNANANAAFCTNCHVYTGQLYTTLTTTPPLSYPTVAGGHQFSQSFSVTGARANCGDTNPNGCFTSIHTNAGLTARCSSCHQYAATTAATNIWSFVHAPANPGVTQSRTTVGCTMCH